jgi:hypothetical protein
MRRWQKVLAQNVGKNNGDVLAQNVLRQEGRRVRACESYPRVVQTNAQTLWLLIRRPTIPKGKQQGQYGTIFLTLLSGKANKNKRSSSLLA